MPSHPGALAGLKVLDATQDVAGQFCGRLFADFGAEVILVEPPDGSATRRLGPFASNRPPPDNSFLFEHLNQGKSTARLDLAGAEGRAAFATLARGADVILVGREAKPLAQALDGLDQPIVCTVSDFGESGPYRNWTGCELIHQALSGVMAVTGSPDREPLFGLGRRASYACGVTAYITCLNALVWRDRTGEGQAVEAVTAEATAAMGQNLLSQYSYNQSYATRRAYPGMLAQLKCEDGWLALFAIRHWPVICQAFGLDELATDARFADVVALRRNWPEAAVLLQAAAHDRKVEPTVAALQKGKVSSERMLTLPELLACEQFEARGMWKRRAGEDRAAALGPVFRTQSPTREAPADAPLLDSAPKLAWTSPARSPAHPLPKPAARGRLPLQGLKVVDFTAAWAGPMTARMLAFMGAEVVKIENASQLDSWRGAAKGVGDPGAYPDRQGGERPYDRNVLFNTQNHDKKSISLNLKDARGRELARRLAAEADVVLANFSPHALTRLGLGYADLSRENPRLIMVEMPAFGNDGPWSGHVGMGKTMEAASGMSSLIGYGDGEPVLTGPAYFDPVGGLHGGAAVMTALAERDVTGKGQYVEVAQVEAALHWIGEFILAASAEGQAFAPQGNRSPWAAPHDAFPAMGDDQWVAVAVTDDAAWRRLREVQGLGALKDLRFETLAGRLEHQDEIAEALAAWTRQRTKHEAADILQAAGVAAAPVNTGADVYRDPFLRARGFVHELDHPAVGVREYPGLAYRLQRTPGAIRSPAPCFGQHIDEVLGGLGLSEAEIETLTRERVVMRAPLAVLAEAD